MWFPFLSYLWNYLYKQIWKPVSKRGEGGQIWVILRLRSCWIVPNLRLSVLLDDCYDGDNFGIVEKCNGTCHKYHYDTRLTSGIVRRDCVNDGHNRELKCYVKTKSDSVWFPTKKVNIAMYHINYKTQLLFFHHTFSIVNCGQ